MENKALNYVCMLSVGHFKCRHGEETEKKETYTMLHFDNDKRVSAILFFSIDRCVRYNSATNNIDTLGNRVTQTPGLACVQKLNN